MPFRPSRSEPVPGTDPASRRRVLTAVAGGTVTGFGGCTSVFEREKTIAYEFTNVDEVAYDVELFVLAADDDEIEVRFEDGETWQRDVTDASLNQLFDTSDPLLSVEPLGDPLNSASFRVEPGAGTGASFPSVPRDAGLLAVTTRAETGRVNADGSWMCPSGTIRELNVQFGRDGERSQGAACVT